jgi:hypothetical protein
MAAVDDRGGSVSSNEFSEENTDYVGEPVQSGQDLLAETPDPGAGEAGDREMAASTPEAGKATTGQLAAEAAGGKDRDSSGSEQVGVEPSAPGPRPGEQIP